MSESTTPTDMPGPIEGDGPADPPADPPKATKQRARKTAAAPTKSKRETSAIYLPALPEGFSYTRITVTGPDGADIDAQVNSTGGVDLVVTGGGIEKDASYDTMAEAVKRGSKAIKGIAKIAEREADLAKAREQAIDL